MRLHLHWLIFFLGWPLVTLSADTAQKETASPLHVEAYSAMIRADQARNNRAWKEAILSYRQAADAYRRLEREQSDWHPDIVQFRVSYCENEIAAIVKKTKISEKKWLTAIDEAEESNYKMLYEQAADEYKALAKELEQVRRDLIKAQQEVEDLRERLVVPPSMTNELARENTALKEELQKVRDHNAALRETIDLLKKSSSR